MKRATNTDGAHKDEGSSVRARNGGEPPSSRRPELATPRSRMDRKVDEAEALLAPFPDSDPRWRLLQAASLRQDEGLVDAILTTLRDGNR